MNLGFYQPNGLERRIESHYRECGFRFASDLDVETVAASFGIDVRYYEGPPFAEWCEEYAVIFLNALDSKEQRRATFFHEICHPLLHVGFQGRNVPKQFEYNQERQAGRFQLYAALPVYMLLELEELSNANNAEKMIAEEFCLPRALVAKRLEQIAARLQQLKLDARLRRWPRSALLP
ncbi:ImmA/IrrE family metallo-endopeptidase [Paenibacillus cymbidii]|uniref:ImmA/IrrE family metallo-endopeptidase n=1 Tax=Paenibacillus cymbidii TaxID=1639034 RepID=UPI0010812F99|nr:ImmA/IrrE family metallo-endopeptidase [Paenibacillus cymbidii]